MFKCCYGANVSWKGENKPRKLQEGGVGRTRSRILNLKFLAFRFRKV